MIKQSLLTLAATMLGIGALVIFAKHDPELNRQAEVAEQTRQENESYLAKLEEIAHRYCYRWDDASNNERAAETEHLATTHAQRLAEVKNQLNSRAVTLK